MTNAPGPSGREGVDGGKGVDQAELGLPVRRGPAHPGASRAATGPPSLAPPEPDPRNVAHDKTVQHDKKAHGQPVAPADAAATPQPGKKPPLAHHAHDEKAKAAADAAAGNDKAASAAAAE
ncbi:MAG: hypothetical protein JWO31_3539 [Phycisphaerales bacterium]|nr:hypothetical protein [Phycisphaerales bacterium]